MALRDLGCTCLHFKDALEEPQTAVARRWTPLSWLELQIGETLLRFDMDVILVLLGLQRDMAERGHSLESIKASIEARKPDFDAYIGTCRPTLALVRKL